MAKIDTREIQIPSILKVEKDLLRRIGVILQMRNLQGCDPVWQWVDRYVWTYGDGGYVRQRC